ncbi:MAG TPA: hypothetical protein VNG13_13210 [Mycobacteriales bacterium]|nr:hypothetical protein [Mycobacteriales bacterium]
MSVSATVAGWTIAALLVERERPLARFSAADAIQRAHLRAA